GALKLARACADRYPQYADSRIALSRLMWRSGDISGGFEKLKSGYQLSSWDWCNVVGKEFVEEFSNKPDDVMLQNLKELVKERVNPNALVCAAGDLGKAGKYQLGFELLDAMSKVNIADQDMFVTAYEYLRKIKSKEEALKWADSQFPARLRGGVSR